MNSAEQTNGKSPDYHPVAPRFLIIEDDSIQAALFAEWLQNQRVEVVLANGPNYAADALAQLTVAYHVGAPFHGAIVDLRLGLGSGLGVSLVKTIHQRFRATHVIICSGDMNLIAQSVAETGFVSVLTKPYKPGEIRRMLVMMRLPVPDA